MKFMIEKLPVQPMVFMRRVGAYGSENYRLMASLKEWAEPKGLLRDAVIYGIAHDGADTPPESCRYDVCLVVPDGLPAEDAVQRGEIPGGDYAVFTLPHTAEAVQAFWASMIPQLQAQGSQFDGERPILERYREQLVQAGQCEFCVPIRSLGT